MSANAKPRKMGGGHGRRAMGGPRPKNAGKTFKRLMGEMLRNYGLRFVIVIICIIVNAYASMKGILFMRTLVDDFIVPLTQQAVPDYSSLTIALRGIAVYFLVSIGATYAYNRIMVNVSQGTMYKLRKRLFDKMETLPIKYFDTHAHGDIMSVYTNDVDTLRQMFGQSIPQIVNSSVTLIATLVTMLILSVPLTIVTILMAVLMVLVTAKLAGKSGKHFVAQQQALGAVDGYIEEMMEGQRVVKVFNHEEKSVEEFAKLNEELRHNAERANTYANIMMPVNANIGNLSYVVCAIVGALIAIVGGGGFMGVVTVGTIIAFLQLNKNFTMPIAQVSMQMNAIVMAMAGGQRVYELLDAEPEEDEGTIELVNVVEEDGRLVEVEERTGMWAWKTPAAGDTPVELRKLEGGVVLEDVDFGYTDEKMVLHNLNLFAKPGQKIAFVGATGAGKTTITNLINRFYDIQAGRITYDGIDVMNIRKPSLRRSLGIVLQETNLFTGTVMENIRYGRLDATDEECIEAARLANADGFIRRLSEGYDTVLEGNGANLSQGQRQLLSIARAAVVNPPALILDEATSSIDTRTERLVQAGMDALMADRTSFVIAHRLSTVKNADCIMVLDQGRIIERGTHDELIAKHGTYYRLYTGNFED